MGANKHKDMPVVSSDNEDDNGGGGSMSCRHGAQAKNRQQQLSPSSLDDRGPQHGLAGFVATGLTRPTMTMPLPLLSPTSFSDTIKKTKVADAATWTAEAKKVWDEDGQQVQVMALQPSKTQHAVP